MADKKSATAKERGVRGALTPEILKLATENLGHAISKDELRLMAYCNARMTNERTFNPVHLSDEDVVIFDGWVKSGLMTFEGDQIRVTREFWMAISEILYLAYVDCN